MKTNFKPSLVFTLITMLAAGGLLAAQTGTPNGCGNPVPPTEPPCEDCEDESGSGSGGDTCENSQGAITSIPSRVTCSARCPTWRCGAAWAGIN